MVCAVAFCAGARKDGSWLGAAAAWPALPPRWASHLLFVGLAKTVYMHNKWPYIWWFPCQKYRMYTIFIYSSGQPYQHAFECSCGRLLLNCYWTATELLLNCNWTATELQLNCNWIATESLLNCYWTATELQLNCYWTATELLLNCYWTASACVVHDSWYTTPGHYNTP